MERIIQGDVFAALPTLDAGSVHTVVTSPPYWGLRTYLPGVVQLKRNLSPEKQREVIAELERLGIKPISDIQQIG